MPVARISPPAFYRKYLEYIGNDYLAEFPGCPPVSDA
jgi:hypothetical protein